MQLGADDVPDLLAISLGAHDFAGHTWGPDSWEVLDIMLRLDAALGQLFETLDARLGKMTWAVVVTSDHGATPLPERAHMRYARRIPPQEIERAAEPPLDHQLGPGPWVSRMSSDYLYLVPAFAEVPGVTRDAALLAAARAMQQVPGVAVTGRTDRFAGGCDAYKDLERAICLSIVPGEVGELYAFPAQGSLIWDHKTGTNHDAPFDDNRRVPIFVMAPGLAPQTGTGSLLQVSPTLAALLGVPPPEAANLPPLFKLGAR
jgi:predicted AlkP superfamily pyrophosphatase or phosphodiesterase